MDGSKGGRVQQAEGGDQEGVRQDQPPRGHQGRGEPHGGSQARAGLLQNGQGTVEVLGFLRIIKKTTNLCVRYDFTKFQDNCAYALFGYFRLEVRPGLSIS